MSTAWKSVCSLHTSCVCSPAKRTLGLFSFRDLGRRRRELGCTIIPRSLRVFHVALWLACPSLRSDAHKSYFGTPARRLPQAPPKPHPRKHSEPHPESLSEVAKKKDGEAARHNYYSTAIPRRRCIVYTKTKDARHKVGDRPARRMKSPGMRGI